VVSVQWSVVSVSVFSGQLSVVSGRRSVVVGVAGGGNGRCWEADEASLISGICREWKTSRYKSARHVGAPTLNELDEGRDEDQRWPGRPGLQH